MLPITFQCGNCYTKGGNWVLWEQREKKHPTQPLPVVRGGNALHPESYKSRRKGSFRGRREMSSNRKNHVHKAMKWK